MAILSVPPEPGTYTYVLVRADKDASIENAQPIRFVTYSTNTLSRSVEWQGRRVHALFLNDKASATRAWRLGWTDITSLWRDYLESITPAPTSPAQQKIFDALTDDWQSKKQIVANADIKDTEWRTAIRYLVDKGLAEQSGYTNRTYKSRRADVTDG